MRLAFMGSPQFAVPALEALIAAGHEIACVYSQPPKPAGRRGRKIQPTPVHAAAEAHGLEIRTPASLKSVEEQLAFADLELDAGIVVAYGLILPRPILDAPRFGCLNIHPSLLPRWRGAAPIQRAVMAGDDMTGIGIMQMEAGLDTGPVLMNWQTPIGPLETAQELHDRLAIQGAEMIVKALASLKALLPGPQPEEGITYAAKIDKAERRIDWNRPARLVAAHINGLSPNAWCEIEGERVKILRAEAIPEPISEGAPPGSLIADPLTIACAGGAVRLLEVHKEGKTPMTADNFRNGFPLPLGSILK